MENLETVEQENRNELVLEIQAEAYLRETGKWAKFLAIVGFISMGFLAIGAIVMFAISGSMGSLMPFPMWIIGFVYLLIAVIYCFPIYYLLKFANKAKEALDSRSKQCLTESMGFIKSHYKFVGILTIVMLALYPIGIIVAIIVSASSGF
jgi:predicted RND superfamily exporter protein